MTAALLVLAAAALAAASLVVARRRSDLFALELRDGKLAVVRGHPPGSLVGDFEDILPRGVRQGRVVVRARRGAAGAELIVRGVDAGIEQRLRNVFGTYPVSRLRR